MRVWRGERRLPVPVLRAEPGGFMSPGGGGVHVSASTVRQPVLHRRLNAQRRFVEDRDVSGAWGVRPGAGSRVSLVRTRFCSALVWEFCGC